ncbi:MAG: threonine synthase [Bacteroidales bacterium]|nr:threonine synthase [Candidatus Liminaster caballi]
MKYYSTNRQAPEVSLSEAVIKGLAPDKGLYMPESIHPLPQSFFDHIQDMTLQEIAFEVAKAFFGDDIPENDLRHIVYDTLQFDIPLVKVNPQIYSLELYHGPTCAFKDVGARFMARLLSYFAKPADGNTGSKGNIHVLVATSGDTGSAVANGFLGVPGIDVTVLYPQGKVSEIQEKQFTTLGQNITALEVDGVFDDCQRLVKEAFMDKELNEKFFLTSANSINVARFLPQAFYYFYAYAQIKKMLGDGNAALDNVVVCVPSGNFGNICAGLFGKMMGLPVKRFIASNNANDIFFQYLASSHYNPRATQATIANAMDVGDPSNFARIVNLFGDGQHKAEKIQPEDAHEAICQLISGATYNDDQIREAMRLALSADGYVCDPHGACGYQALADGLQPGEVGIFLETAHPAKFKDTVEAVIGQTVAIPETLQRFMNGKKQTLPMTKEFADFKAHLLASL